MTCQAALNFTIDGHNLTVIEVDGNTVENVTVDSIQIFPGQRYSFVLEATQKVDNYWIRAERTSKFNFAVPSPIPDSRLKALLFFLPQLPKALQFFLPSFFTPSQAPTALPNGMATLHYAGAPLATPTTRSNPTMPLVETDLHPLENPAAPGNPWIGGANHTIELNITFDDGKFFINNKSFFPPSVPVLLQILSGQLNASELIPKGSVHKLPHNQVIELSFPVINTTHHPPVSVHCDILPISDTNVDSVASFPPSRSKWFFRVDDRHP